MSSTSLSLEDINTVSWVLGSFAIVLSVGRFFIRWKAMNGFRSDDYLHLGAVIFMITDLGLFSGSIGALKEMEAFDEGKTQQPPSISVIQGGSVADSILFFSCLWCVKLAFLMFYRQLFNISKGFSVAWWSVLVFNIVTYWICVAGDLVQCGGNATYLMNLDVCNNDYSLALDVDIFIYSYVMIVASDLATMALPLVMVHQLQMRRSQKLAVGGILCLSFVSVAFESLRLGESLQGLTSNNSLWVHIEEIVAVIVSALPSYYALVNLHHKRTSHRYYSAGSGANLKPGFSTSATSRTIHNQSIGSWSDAYSAQEHITGMDKEHGTNCV